MKTSTAHNYSYTERGIYNQYEHSGTVINDSCRPCGLCQGSGLRELDLTP